MITVVGSRMFGRSWRLVGRIAVAGGILAAGPPTANANPKVKSVCGTVVTLHCEHGTPKPSLMVQIADKDGAFVFLDAAWIDAVSGAEGYVGAEVCGTGVEEKRHHDKYLRLDDRSQLKVVRNLSPLLRRFGEGAHWACEEDVQMPVLKRDARPTYTQAAMDAMIQGSVLLEAVVQADGHVGETRIIRSLDKKYGLDREAIRACQAWLFEPAQLDGSPVPLIVTMELSFTLK